MVMNHHAFMLFCHVLIDLIPSGVSFDFSQSEGDIQILASGDFDGNLRKLQVRSNLELIIYHSLVLLIICALYPCSSDLIY